MRKQRVLATLATAMVGLTGVMMTGSCGDSGAPAGEDMTTPHVVGKPKEAVGKYIVTIAGCNDCHTPGGFEGKLPEESEWLTGTPLGFNGPWGTTYAANLRLKLQSYPTEQMWVEAMKKRTDKPPMPWGSLHNMTDANLGAVYAYIRGLGPKGVPTPDAVPPGVEPKGPYIVFAPPTIGGSK
jgi:mono/diheme cytochrome c family protein